MRHLMRFVVIVAALACAASCEQKADSRGRSGEVVKKFYAPGGNGMSERWTLHVQGADGQISYVSVDATDYHRYDVGDSYP